MWSNPSIERTSSSRLRLLAAAAHVKPSGRSKGRFAPFGPPHNEDEEAKGYVHQFPAEVNAGVIHGTHGTEGQPGWHFLSGPIGKDGTASLTLQGIVSNADYSVNHAYRGKPYVYRVRAKFEPASGVGQRIGKRKCEFQFRRP